MTRPTTRSRISRPKATASASTSAPHCEKAQQYVDGVLAGKIPAGKLLIAACRRHKSDLEKAESDWPYRFDPAKAERPCKFIEALPHVKGQWAQRGEKIHLEPWQCFIVTSLFGWVDKTSGLYRFREAYIEVPRKNAKSTLAAGIGLYKFCADGEFGAEVYAGATTEKQAWEVMLPAKLMAKNTPKLLSAFGIEVHGKSLKSGSLTIAGKACRFEPVIGKPGDGASPSCAIVDEYHEHATDDLQDTMKTGMGARQNPLLFDITTGGSNRAGPCYALRKDVEKVLNGIVENDRLFGIIYTIDDDDDWKTDAALFKANPNLGVSIDIDFLRASQRDAVQSARKQNTFQAKHLNLWPNADVAWMNQTKWDACGDPALKIEQFEKQDCIVGVDLASRVDLVSKIRMFRRVLDEKDHFYVFGSYYLNEQRIQEANGQHYFGWANEGRLTATPGNITDYTRVADELVQDTTKFVVREIAYDPYHAAPMIQFIEARPDWTQGVISVEVRQTIQNMSPAMKELEAIVFDGRLHHDGDPILAWMISNVVCHRDVKDNIFPRKEREQNKIDGVIATLMALLRWMAQPKEVSQGIELW